MSSMYGSVATARTTTINEIDEDRRPLNGGVGGGGSGVGVVGLRVKQGHSCCLGCCDVRRAVICVNMMMITFLLMDLFVLLRFSMAEKRQQFSFVDDDELQKTVRHMSNGPTIFLFIVEIVLLVITIIGALTFSSLKVVIGLVVYGIGFISSIFRFNLPAIVLMACFAYPHYYLYMEIESGIMSAENYFNEEQSCCCV